MVINNKILVILGPTSSGKSEVAIKLAKKYNGEIISADSRQVYRGMDIGTGKVPKSKCKNLTVRQAGQNAKLQSKIQKEIYYSQGIPHYMIDIVSPKTEYNVAKFKKAADKIILDMLRCGKLTIICGGTGFWIKAIVDNVQFPAVKPDWKLRKELSRLSTLQLFEVLKSIDLKRAKTIDKNNKIRLIRAIEIVREFGKVPTADELKRLGLSRPQRPKEAEPLKFLQIGIKIPKEKLYANIKKRLEARFRQGMIREVINLKKSGLSWKKIQSFGLGYYWIPLYLEDKLTKQEVFEKIYLAEKNYAKRQMTWFKKDKRIKWIESYKEIEEMIKNFIKK